MVKIAQRFQTLRKERRLTQAAVYEDTGISIERIETGHRNISITTIRILCEYYEVTLGEFFRDMD